MSHLVFADAHAFGLCTLRCHFFNELHVNPGAQIIEIRMHDILPKASSVPKGSAAELVSSIKTKK